MGRGRIWSGLTIAVAIAAWSMAVAPSAWAAPGPRLATVELINTKASERERHPAPPLMDLSSFGPEGGGLTHLVAGKLEDKGVAPMPFYAPAWSPDGSVIVFGGYAGKGSAIYLVNADGSGLRRVPGTGGGVAPVIAPDDRTIAFSRSKFHLPKFTVHGQRGKFYSSTSTWVVDAQAGGARQITKWGNGVDNTPSSFSPDGSTLAVTRSDSSQEGPSVVLMHPDGSGANELAPLAEEPEISPDGTRVAFVGYKNSTHIEAEESQDYDIGELYTMRLDGTGLTRLTRNKQWIETSPSWDPSGQRLAYVQMKADTSFVPGLALLFPSGNSIIEMNADGSCRGSVRSNPKVALYGVTWQGGAEHAAAPIAC